MKNGGLFSFSDIIKGINSLIDLAEKVEAAGGKKAYHGETVFPGKNEIKGTYNFNVSVGGLAERIQEVDHLISKAQNLAGEDVPEPVLDVFDEGEYIVVVAELPEINEKNIKVEVEGNYLIIRSDYSGNGTMKVELPANVERKWKVAANNGIVKITLPKAGAAGPDE